MDETSKLNGQTPVKVNEELYSKMIEEISDYAIFMLDLQGNILNWNKGAQAIKGYKADEIVGKNFRVFYTPQDQDEKLPETLLELAARQGRATHEGWRVRKDGSRFWGSIVITALHDDNSAIIGFSKVARDLTERKMAEERLELYAAELLENNEMLSQSEKRYHLMINEVEDYAIILLDIHGNIQNWNKGAEKIKGYKESEVMGKNFRIFYPPQDQQEGLPQHLLDLAATHNTATHEGWRMRKDGTRFWGSIVITALHDLNGEVVGYSKVTRDLTQKKQFEEQIIMQNKQLEEYAYVASHDLQEPLRKIMIFANMMEDDIRGNEKAMENLLKINAAAGRMSNLIRSVLLYSQSYMKTDLFTEVDLNEVIRNIETDFEMLLQEKKGRITFGKLPVIHAIPIQMHQLFSNLVNNAIKFNDSFPEIHIASQPSVSFSGDGNNGHVVLTVSDNGIGFDQEHEEKMFRMFYKLHDSKTGTGIGLALCKKIVENHRGSIRAVSHGGKGTTFEIVLPVNAL